MVSLESMGVNQTTNYINDIVLMEIISIEKGYKILNSEETKAYNEYLKTQKNK